MTSRQLTLVSPLYPAPVPRYMPLNTKWGAPWPKTD